MIDTRKFNSRRYSKSFEVDKLTSIRIRKMLELIDPCNKLLDIGCWDGFIMNKIMSTNKVHKVEGTDNSLPAIKRCHKKGLKATLIKSADQKLPFRSGEFDAVTAGEIIEHLFDVNNFLKEVNRILKPGGQFILTTPNLASLGARLTLLSGKIPWMIENELDTSNSGHIRYFTFDVLEKMLNKHKFEVDKKNCDFLHIGKFFYLNADSLTKKLYSLGRIILIHAIKI